MIKSLKRIVSWVMVVSLFLLSLPMMPGPVAQSSLTSAKATISDSYPGATGVTYLFDFTTNVNATSVTFTFEDAFTSANGALPEGSGDYACPAPLSLTATTSSSFTCANGTLTAGAATSSASNVTNPTKVAAAGTADTYTITIATNADERVQVKVAIIEAVVVTATVDAILEFTISGVDASESVKNTTTNATTTATAIPFGTLPLKPDSVVAAQDLNIRTNASEGFVVVVFQDQDLTSAAGDNIHCFTDGVCATYDSPVAWDSPTGIIDATTTYGHFGFTSEDAGVAASCLDEGDYGTGYYGSTTTDLWAGFSGTNQAVVMCHTGPVDGQVQHKSLTRVAYQVEITALQSAGDYTNTLTYIATPTY